jgi:nitrate reductase NapE component|tara:strand:+ start:299 stop:502 length:204 start_codon:yes stop_codon:yes gene_type:complete
MLNRNQVIQNSELSTSQDKKLNKKNRVDINILLNRVRADKKKEKLETFLVISLVSLSVLATGLIVSL